MKNRPSLTFMVLLCVLLLGGMAGFRALSRADAVAGDVATTSHVPDPLKSWLAIRHANSKIIRETTARSSREEEKAAREMKELLLAEFPTLRVEEHPVADDQNGFRLLFELGSLFANNDLPLSEEFRGILNGTVPWDTEAARRCLAEPA
jgi:hypothetical protein